MRTTLTIIESLTFLALAGIHFHWVFGGKLGFDEAVPTNEEGKKMLNPGKKDSTIVGLGLLMFGLFFLVKGGHIDLYLPTWINNYGGFVISVIFFLRAMGDFNYVGFFKKSRATKFSKLDSQFFSPLCLLLALIGLFLSI
ncbi:MAG: hypothetical protein ACI9IP_001546 [Arcticibacterium sp.]|jgi:hypothetical protein